MLRRTDPMPDDGPDRDVLRESLADSAAHLRAEQFPWQTTVDRMLEVHAGVTDDLLVPA